MAGTLGLPTVAGAVGGQIPGVTIEYKRCKVAFVSNASAIETIAVYYADREDARQAVYDIDPTTSDRRQYAPLAVRYNATQDRTQIRLAEPKAGLVCIIAEAGADTTRKTNPTAPCVPPRFNTAPVASFEVSPEPTVDEVVTVTSTATDDDTPERLQYDWDLDDDGTFETSGHTATVVYTTPGPVTIRHRVTDDFGASDVATRTVTVDPAPPFEQVAKLTASDGESGDFFGWSVSVNGDTALVGAYLEDGTETDEGAAYVFERNAGGANAWGQVAKLAASDAELGDFLGRAVSIDGDTALISAPGEDEKGTSAGAAYVFERNAGGADAWGQVAKLAPDDGSGFASFGTSVSVEGDTALVGARLEFETDFAGGVFVFERNHGGTDAWGEVARLAASDGEPDDEFGQSVSVDGETALVGAWLEDEKGTSAGAAYVFARNEGGADAWGEVTKLTASDGGFADLFGQSVSVDGDTALVGASRDGEIAPLAGAAYVFERDAGGTDAWGEVTKLTASGGEANVLFGGAVSVEGDTVLIGAISDDAVATSAGAAYVFERNEGGADAWGEVAKLTASDGEANDLFGRSVSVDGGTALVGANFEDDNGSDAGAAYVFE